MPDKLNTTEAAEVLGYTRDHVYRLCRQGFIKAEQFNRVWMIDRAEVERIKAMQDEYGNLPRGTLSP